MSIEINPLYLIFDKKIYLLFLYGKNKITNKCIIFFSSAGFHERND